MKNGFLLAALLSVAAVAALVYALRPTSDNNSGDRPLEFYCAMGISEPVKEILADYQQRYGTPYVLVTKGSGELIGNIKTSGRADLYLAADASYMDTARQQGLDVREVFPLAYQQVVIAVHKGNPLGIRTIDDVIAKARAGQARVYLASPELAAISRAARKELGKELWDQLWEVKATGRDTVTAVVNDVTREENAVGLIWNTTAEQYPKVEMISIPQCEQNKHQITLCVLGSSQQPTPSIKLARFVAAADEGLKVFKKHGYDVASGDQWAEGRPELTFFSGGLNQEAVAPAVEAFKKREGVDILPVYAGCGELVGRMKPFGQGIGEQPDLYFACQTGYMNQVADMFYEPVDVSGTDMVLAVTKGNKKQIKGLDDLVREGVKVGLCDEKKSALGYASARLLERHGLLDRVKNNTLDFTATAPALVAKVAADGLDAAIVYRANVTHSADKLEVIEIDDPDVSYRQPIAVSRMSKHPQLARRLVEAIMSAESQARFENLGFRWYGNTEAKP